jgi:hypothetical protein
MLSTESVIDSGGNLASNAHEPAAAILLCWIYRENNDDIEKHDPRRSRGL